MSTLRCCKRHDRCYGEVRCTFLAAQFVGYSTDGCSEEEVKSGKCKCTWSTVIHCAVAVLIFINSEICCSRPTERLYLWENV